MPESTGEQPDRYEQARRRAKEKVDFLTHVCVFVVSIALMAAINLLTSPHHLWFFYPLAGWGAAVLFHFMGTFVFGEGTALQRRMLERELRHAGPSPRA